MASCCLQDTLQLQKCVKLGTPLSFLFFLWIPSKFTSVFSLWMQTKDSRCCSVYPQEHLCRLNARSYCASKVSDEKSFLWQRKIQNLNTKWSQITYSCYGKSDISLQTALLEHVQFNVPGFLNLFFYFSHEKEKTWEEKTENKRKVVDFFKSLVQVWSGYYNANYWGFQLWSGLWDPEFHIKKR